MMYRNVFVMWFESKIAEIAHPQTHVLLDNLCRNKAILIGDAIRISAFIMHLDSSL